MGEALDRTGPQLHHEISADSAHAEDEGLPAERPTPSMLLFGSKYVEEPAEEQPQLQRAVSQRVQEAISDPAPPVRTWTDDDRGYCSEPEDVEVNESEWHQVEEVLQQPPTLLRTRTDEERGYCSEPEEPVTTVGEWAVL